MLDDSDGEDFQSADITILPPDNNAGTDGDSGDELVASGDPNRLSRNQLLAEACVRVRKPDGDVVLGMDEDKNFQLTRKITELSLHHP